jgi:hypothetical protein
VKHKRQNRPADEHSSSLNSAAESKRQQLRRNGHNRENPTDIENAFFVDSPLLSFPNEKSPIYKVTFCATGEHFSVVVDISRS